MLFPLTCFMATIRRRGMGKIINWFRTEFFTRETLAYLLIGLTNTVINWTATYVMNNVFGIGYWVTSVLTFLFGVAFTYIMNKKYAFRSAESDRETLPKYLIEVLVCFAVSYGLGKIVLDWFFSRVFVPDIAPEKLNTVKGILANICYIGLNYIGQKFFVFRKKKEE